MSDKKIPYDEASSSQPLRNEFVENARRFFKNPKIRSTPLDEQKKFLLRLDTLMNVKMVFEYFNSNFDFSLRYT